MYGDVIHIMWVRMIEEASLLAEPNHIIPLLCDRPGTYSSDTIISYQGLIDRRRRERACNYVYVLCNHQNSNARAGYTINSL